MRNITGPNDLRYNPSTNEITYFEGSITATSSSGAGTSDTPVIDIDNQLNNVFLRTSTNPASNGIILSITSTDNRILIFTPYNAVTAALSGTSTPYLNRTSDSSHFNFIANSTALAADTNYVWTYSFT